jgi:hypothetical protein
MQCTFPSPSSPSYISTPRLLLREVAFGSVCRALAALPPPPSAAGALLLLPLALRPQLEEALAVLVDLLDGARPAPATSAGERSSLAALPRAPGVPDLLRVAVKYLAPAAPPQQRRGAPHLLAAPEGSSSSGSGSGGGSGGGGGGGGGSSSGGSGGSAAPAPDLLTFACAAHGLQGAAAPLPAWVGVVAPELLVGEGPPEGAAPPRPDALALNTALALLCGAPGAPALHVHFCAPRGEGGEALARVLQRAAAPLCQ